MIHDIPPMIFDIPPPGQDPGEAPVVRQPRRTPFVDPSIQAMKDYLALQAELAKQGPRTNWAEILKKLPKDDEENIDWMAALDQNIIQPRGTIDADTPAPEMPEPDAADAVDVTLSTSGKPERLVVFSHAAHGRWLNCANCHPAVFEKRAGSAKITMDAMEEGKYCGVCHDKVALAQPNECTSCHKVKVKKKS
jgi:c(7)-type cytochrome triheme protein